MNDEIRNFMLEHMEKPDPHPIVKKKEPKSEVSPDEAMEIFRELLDVYVKHDVSYQCACKISLAFNEAMMTGAVEIARSEFS
jgi:hypothetical protein